MTQIFYIEGIPIPQGSKTAKVVNGRVVMWESNKKLKAWRDLVTLQVRNNMLEQYSEFACIKIGLTFEFVRPKSSKRKMPNVKPDLDKLTRAVFDGLTKSGIYHDDAQVVSLRARKTYVTAGGGCSIMIERLDV
jgi:Holliday junction resolvase RusA-like endonuclease